jgi:hypothetical protein
MGWKAFESQMASLVHQRKSRVFEINALYAREWRNYVSPHTLCQATHSSDTSDRTLPFLPHFLHPAPRPISMMLTSLLGK